MAEVPFFDSPEDAPEQLRSFLVEQDGRWTLPLQDADSRKNADDVRKALSARDNERAEAGKLRQQIEDLQAKIKGIDLDQLPDAMDALKQREELEQQKLISEKRFEEAAEQKYKRQIAEMNRQIETMKQNADQQKQQYEALFGDFRKVRVNEALAKEFMSAGLDPDFLDAAINMVSTNWEIDPETREPTPIEMIDGGKQKVTATGANGQPLTMKEQATTFLRDRPKWAMASNGSNASHQNTNGSNLYRISAEDAQDFTKYQQAKANAEKAGVELEITQ